MRRRLISAWIALLLIWFVWGSTYFAIRLVVLELPPLVSAGLRFALAGIVIGAAALIFERRQERPRAKQIGQYAIVGCLLFAGGNALVMSAERTVPSGIAAIVVATVALWVTFLDGLRPGGQPWTMRVWIGALLGVAGVALIARPEGPSSVSHLIGIGLLLLASLIWSIGSVFAQSIRDRLPLLTSAAIEMLSGSAALFVESRLAGEDLAALTHASSRAYLGWAYLVVFGSIIAFTAFVYALENLPASLVGTYAYVNPLVALVLGALFLDEPLSRGLLGGAALIVVGVVLTSWPRSARLARRELALTTHRRER